MANKQNHFLTEDECKALYRRIRTRTDVLDAQTFDQACRSYSPESPEEWVLVAEAVEFHSEKWAQNLAARN